MGDAWPARWPPPPPLPSPPPPPPPQLPSQMDSVNLRRLFRSFPAQEASVGGRAAAVAASEQLAADPSISRSGLPVKAVPSSSLLAQHVPGNHPQVAHHAPDLKSLLDRTSASSGAGIIDLTRAPPFSGTATLPKYPRHGLSAGTSSSSEQSSLGAVFLNRSVNAQGASPGEVSAKDGISQGTIQFHGSNAHTMQKLPSRPFPRHHPVLLGDRIHVSCLNVGGELFVSEAGLFGVLCFCHRLRMSVDKFCEHAGGPAEKVGEIVHMENGMSIAHWFKYCIGAGASIAETKWDFPEWNCMDTSKNEYRPESILARNSSTEKMGLFSGYGKINGPTNKPIYDSDVCNEGRGFISIEKLVNKPDETCYRNSVDAHEVFTKNYALQQNSELNLGLAKNNTVHAASPIGWPSGRSNAGAYVTAHMGGNGGHFTPSYANPFEKNFDASFHNHGPSSTGVLNYGSRTCRSGLPQKTSQNSLGYVSNTELKLGQSSYHQPMSMTNQFPLVHSSTVDFQSSQSHLPLITQNPSPWQTSKDNKNKAEHTELLFRNKKQPLEVVNDINHSEADELTDDATKNSFISLFLSHLERNSTSESVDDILNSNEHCLPKALDAVYSPDHSKIASRLLEPRAKNNHSKSASTIIHKKMISDGRSLPVASSGPIPQDVPHASCEEPLIHGDCAPHFLPSQPSAGTTKICAGVSCPANCRSHNHVADKFHQVAHAEIGVPCLYGKTARRHCTFECVDELCMHKSLRSFDEVICQCGKSYSSSQEFQPSFGQNHQPTMGKPINGCCCKVQDDISNLSFRSGQSHQTHFPDDSAPILAHKHTVEGLDEFCACSTFIPRTSLCCRQQISQSYCHPWPIDGFQHRSSMGHTTNSLTKNHLLDVPNKKEPGPCWDGRCCYPVATKCLAGCAFTKHCDVRTDQNDCTVPKSKHGVPNSAKRCTLGEDEKLICQCSRNIFAGRSNSQVSFWKDISQKVMNHPCVPTRQSLKNVSEASVAGDIWTYGGATEQRGACKDSGVYKEQWKSDFSAGSSSAVVTKFPTSPEFNTISSCAAKYGVEHKNPEFDEGSRIEKCSSSNYVPTDTRCEEALNSFSRFQLDPSNVKGKLNQISVGSTLMENDNDEQCFHMPKKSRTLRCSAKCSESGDCTKKISSQSSQKEHSQPQVEVSSLSCRVSKPKRKHDAMHLNKPVKRLHSHHKILEGDCEQSYDKGILLGELNCSDREKQEEDMTSLKRTKHQQEGSHVFVRKLPKFVSLNCIVNEPNSEDACRGTTCIDSSLIATGITNDNRKSPKIVPLDLVLKRAKRCHAVRSLCKTESIQFSEEESTDHSVDEVSFGNESCSYSSNTLRPLIEAVCRSPCSDLGESKHIGLTDVKTSQLSVSASRFAGIKSRRASISLNRIIKMRKKITAGSTCSPHGDKDNAVQACEVNAGRYKERLNSDAPCCVCGISNLEPCNQLIECSKCYIKVHQACYGVLKVPRGQWFCRPCKINAKGTQCMLQSETEGEHNEKVGFYGTCLDHATLDHPKKKCLTSNKRTCARTESSANYEKPKKNSCEYSVSQEQINAWLRINGSKSCIRGQKEYIHYKQLKGWKHLVVYKSGIHGLGLYTSEFILRGSMVVEYVGEIVGQRVADKREREYQSGKRQQYKGACYFFKIDKEHIVDATRKGGIARFINHSCLPNCVAKIISVRNEKKVVFFAERHINPGEEITYDYHFNREDEGQRIPCFCGSKGCRRYLN